MKGRLSCGAWPLQLQVSFCVSAHGSHLLRTPDATEAVLQIRVPGFGVSEAQSAVGLSRVAEGRSSVRKCKELSGNFGSLTEYGRMLGVEEYEQQG